MKAYKLEISEGYLLLLCAYACFDPGGSFLWYLLSVCVHEAAHLGIMYFFHIPVFEIRFGLRGAMIAATSMTYRQEFLVAAAGPIANGLLLLTWGNKVPILGFVNLVLLFYNLLPVYPLDGGRLLRAVLRSLLPLSVAELLERVCVLSCMVFLLAGAGYLSFGLRGGLWPILFCAFLFFRLGETFLPKKEIST